MRRLVAIAGIGLYAAACGAKSELDVESFADLGDAAPVVRDAGPPCVPGPVEVCNDRDDDCDGTVDEGTAFGPVAGPYAIDTPPRPPAFGTALVGTRDGILSVWHVGFDGSAPPPTNSFSRRLDRDGRPIAPAREILMRNATWGLTAAPSSRDRVVLTFCGRYGGEDHTTSAFLDASGAMLGSDVERAPRGRSCGAANQYGLWTGERHLFAWTDNSSAPVPGQEVLLDVATEEGLTVSALDRELTHEGDLSIPPRMALGHGRVAVVSGYRPEPRVSMMRVWMFGTEGRVMGDAVDLGPIGETVALGDGVIGPTRDGWLVLADDRFEHGLYGALLSADGRVVAPLERTDAPAARHDDLELAPYRDGFVVIGNAYPVPSESTGFVALLDATGRETFRWESVPGGEPYLAWPSLVVRGGRVFVQYASPLDDEGDAWELRLREFGCVAP